MWELGHKESWVPKNWCFWIVVLEKTLENPLDCKEIQPVNPQGNQSWMFIGRTDVEAEAPILWTPDVKNWFTGKDPDAGKYWRQEEKGMIEDRDGWMASPTQWTWVWVNSRVGDGQGGLACCSPWGHKESDMTERLNWTEMDQFFFQLLKNGIKSHLSTKLNVKEEMLFEIGKDYGSINLHQPNYHSVKWLLSNSKL